jgi:sialic acid synthase
MGKKLVAARALPAGHVLKAEDIAIKSPGDGVPAYELPKFIGRKLSEPMFEDQAFTLDLIRDFVKA